MSVSDHFSHRYYTYLYSKKNQKQIFQTLYSGSQLKHLYERKPVSRRDRTFFLPADDII